jgi:hypothetical protein
MNTAREVLRPGGVRPAAPLVASTNLVRFFSALDPALAALALAEMRCSFLLPMDTALQAATTIYKRSLDLVIGDLA